MKASLKPELRIILKTTCANVYPSWPDQNSQYPCETYALESISDISYADDRPDERIFSYWVRIWGNDTEEVEAIFELLDAAMLANGWDCAYAADGYTDDKEVKHARYTKSITEEEENQ